MRQAQRTLKIVVISGETDTPMSLSEVLGSGVDIVHVGSLNEAQAMILSGVYDFVLAAPKILNQIDVTGRAAGGPELTQAASQGVAILNRDGEFVWANPRVLGFAEEVRRFVSEACVEMMSRAATAASLDSSACSTGRCSTFDAADGSVYELTATPIMDTDRNVTQVVAVVWDMTLARKRQQQLAAIDHAGRELVRLDPEHVSRLDALERLSLLEQKIIRYLRELMHFDNFSIRILDKKTNRLEPVLSWGLPADTCPADLYALPDGNGICGYVVFHGRSYICPDVSKDPRYFKCIEGAQSSLTVPLRLNDEVIGELNVESRQKDVFDEECRQLAEIFGRDIAVALHILDLLVTERYTTTGRLGSDVMAEISGPVNDILTDVENLIEDYIGHDDLRHRLNKITGTAVGIRDAIKRVTSPKRGLIGGRPSGVRRTDPLLTGKTILIADDETMIRDTVRDVLASYGCVASVADDGTQAIELISQNSYDLVLSDIRMPGRDGYQVFAAAKEANKDTPVILMTGFGYDPNHAIIRARREGLAAVLFKPFKVDQLLGEIRTALRNAPA